MEGQHCGGWGVGSGCLHCDWHRDFEGLLLGRPKRCCDGEIAADGRLLSCFLFVKYLQGSRLVSYGNLNLIKEMDHCASFCTPNGQVNVFPSGQ